MQIRKYGANEMQEWGQAIAPAGHSAAMEQETSSRTIPQARGGVVADQNAMEGERAPLRLRRRAAARCEGRRGREKWGPPPRTRRTRQLAAATGKTGGLHRRGPRTPRRLLLIRGRGDSDSRRRFQLRSLLECKHCFWLRTQAQSFYDNFHDFYDSLAR